MKKILGFFLVAVVLLLVGCTQSQANANSATNSISNPNAQKVNLRALNTGFYDQLELRVKAGQPVEFSFSADPDSACGRELLIPAFGVNLLSKNGETKTVTFTPQTPGVYDYHCGMRMFNGKLKVE